MIRPVVVGSCWHHIDSVYGEGAQSQKLELVASLHDFDNGEILGAVFVEGNAQCSVPTKSPTKWERPNTQG